MGGGVAEQQERPAGQERERLATWYEEYFLVDAPPAIWMVSAASARVIERELDRWPKPRWLRFVDILGARIRVRTAWVKSIQQSTPETRELWRRWMQERQQEDGGQPGMGVPW
jgi:hypothetical protein